MPTLSILKRFRNLFFLLLFALPLLSDAQDCPAPTNALVIYDPSDPWQAAVDWFGPSTTCDILGYEIEYAFNYFVPGTGSAWNSLFVGGPIASIYIPGAANNLHVYIRTICDAPCGLIGGGDGNGNGASGWVLADVFIAPPPPPPSADGAGECSNAAAAYPIVNGCQQAPAFFFWGIYEESYLTTNPCSGDDEYMIWQEYVSPPLGEVNISGTVFDLDFLQEPDYESFGIILFGQGCEGSIIACETSMTEGDTLTIALPPGETFVLGAWFNNYDYDNNPEFGLYSGLELHLSLCEPEPDCAYPTGISISQITDQSIEIAWDDAEGTSWIFEYGPIGFSLGTGSEVLIETGSPYLLQGLQSETEYEFYLETICSDNGTTSINIGPTAFSTYPSITIEETIADGYLYCCDDLILPASIEVEAFCDSIYFTHSDSIVGDACPYTIHRTITVHDTCGNSIQTAFQYDILDNQIPCGCEAEIIVEKEEDEIRVAIHGEWAVLANGDIDEIYHLEEGDWILYDTINVNSSFINSLGIYDDVIVETNHVYRLTADTWNFETILVPSITGGSTTPHVVAVHENTIAYELNDMIFIFEYADGIWSEVAVFEHDALKLDMGENVLLAAVEFGDNIGRIYRKTEGTWAMEQELPNFHPDNNGNGLGRDAAIDGDFAAIGYKWGGGLFTYKYNGENWEPDEFLTNPYQVNPGGGYATCFGSAVDIEGDLMVVGDYFNAVNDFFSGSIAVFERSCGQWVPQRNIVPSNGEERQRFGGCLSLQGSRMAVGVDNQYWLGGITYQGIGHYWFYECLESNPTYTLNINSDLSVECLADIPPAELAYELGNAWCSSTEVSIVTDTLGTECDLTITRVFTASDSSGNSASATQIITVLDNQSPEILNAPENIIATCIEELESYDPVFVDNCTADLQIIFSADTIEENCTLIIGHSWVATDNCGNSTSIVRYITINHEPPAVVYAPEDLAVSCIENIENIEPVFSDLCSDSLVVIFETDTIGEGCNLLIEQSWSAFNSCGESTTVSRTIAVDIESPTVVSAPENVSSSCDDIFWDELEDPVFSHNCNDDLEIIFWSDTLSDACSTVIEFHWIAVNDCGNQTEVMRTVTISDETPPVVTDSLPDITISCTEELPQQIPSFIDNCTNNLQTVQSADTILNDGCTTSIIYTWEATDYCGNSTSTQRIVNINDESPPTLECPENFTVLVLSADDSYTLINLLESVSSNDDCASVQLSQSIPPGTPLQPGIHSILISASDGCYFVDCTVEIDVSIDTGINDPNDIPISVYPNPSSGEVNIELPKAGLSTIQLFDMAGKTLLTKEMSTQLITLNLGHLSSGVYTLLIYTDDYRVVKKLVLE